MFRYCVNEEGGITILKFLGENNEELRTVTVPKEIDGKPVTKIGEEAFMYCDLTEIKLQEGITEIGDEEFFCL